MGIGKEILKANGLYTKKDVERFEENNTKLWDTLNEVYSYLSVYVNEIEYASVALGENDVHLSALWSIANCCRELHIAEEKAKATLHECRRTY